jgi:hypothetical protein
MQLRPYQVSAIEGLRSGCSVPDCERKHEARGLCAKHYTRMKANGTVCLAREGVGELPTGGKPVPGFENYYCATPDGRVFSLNYHNTGRTRELAQSSLVDRRRSSDTFYRRAKMSHITRGTPTAIHRIIALTFIPNPENLSQVNHIDGDKGNNRVENLEWTNNAANQKHAYLNGLHIYPKGEAHPMAELTEEQVMEIRSHLNCTPKFKGQLVELGDLYGVSNSTICDIKMRKTWRHLP